MTAMRPLVGSWVWPLALALGALALYASTLDHAFVADDEVLVSGNPLVTSPSLVGFVKLWTIDYWQAVDEHGDVVPLADDRNLFRPITIASLWLNGWLGVRPATFRMVNALLHAAAAWMVGRLCVAWTGTTGAAIASLAVLVHPAATDVVNRIVGRADILVLLGVAGFLSTQGCAERRGWTAWRTLVATCWAGIAFGAKESGAILLPLALLQAWLGRGARDGRAAPGAAGGRGATAARVAPAAVALVVPLIAYLAGRAHAVALPHYRPEATWDLIGNPLWGVRFADRLAAAGALAWEYTRALVFPWPLVAFNVPATLPTWTEVTPWLGAVVVAALAATALVGIARGRTRAPARAVCAFAAGWWLACFAVVAQLIAPIGAYFEVRFVYPFLGSLALAVALGAERIAGGTAVDERAPATSTRPTPPGSSSALPRQAAMAVLLVVVALAATAVVVRNRDFRTIETLLRADVRRRPTDPAVLLRLANLLDSDGRTAEAEEAYSRVSTLAPGSAEATFELGDFYLRHGRTELGKPLVARAVAINPLHYLASLRLGNLALESGDLRTAQTWLERAALAAPDDPFVAYAFAVLDDARGDRASAIARLETLIARRPDFTLAVRGLAQLKQAHPGAPARR